MTWKIGPITLPINPREVVLQRSRDVKVRVTGRRVPLLLDLGLKAEKLVLKGFLAESGKTLAQIETDYLDSLVTMVARERGVRRRIADDDQITVWTINKVTDETTNNIAVSLSNATDLVKFGSDSLGIQAIAGTECSRWFLYKNYTTDNPLDMARREFISFWWYGQNTGASLQLWLAHDGWTIRAKYDFLDNFLGWKRFVVHKHEFTLDSGFKWDSITTIAIEMWSQNIIGDWRLDRVMAGIGYLVEAPDSRYDGIYLPSRFDFREVGGRVRVLDYTLELIRQDEEY